MKAVLYAAEIANRSGGTVILLYVGGLKQDREAPAAELEGIAAIARKSYPDVRIVTEMTEGDPVSEAIVEVASKRSADMIILGSRGMTGIGESYLGSVSAGTLRHTKVPLMIIPYDYMVEEPDGILLASNHFEENVELLRPVGELAKLFSARVHVSMFVEKDRTEAAEYLLNTRHLEFFAEFLRRVFPGMVVKEEMLDGKSFEDTLERYQEKQGIDIVALVAYPKNFWERLTRKSMTRKFALHSTVPVLALPAGAY